MPKRNFSKVAKHIIKIPEITLYFDTFHLVILLFLYACKQIFPNLYA